MLDWLNRFKPRTLQNRLIVIITAVLLLLISISGTLFMTMTARILEEQVGRRALALSKGIAEIPEIKNLLMEKDPNRQLQAMIEPIRKSVNAQFIVIGDKDGIRYAHPNPTKLDHNMNDDDGDNNEPSLVEGRSYIAKAKGSLGHTIRGKSPIFDKNGNIIGIVSVGYLVERVQSVISSYILTIKIFLVIAVFSGVFCAIYIARSVKRAIFGLEPKEIANLLQEKSAILESIREGLVAINETGHISMINHAAIKILNVDDTDTMLGQSVREFITDDTLDNVLNAGAPTKDKELMINDIPLIVNMYPVVHNKSVIGAVASFRKKDELYRLAKELSRVKEYSEMLRAQSHEYSNTLHTIAGLLQIEAYTEALEMIIKESSDYQDFIKLMTSTITDPVISAVIIGKYNYAHELNITFQIDPDSSMTDIPDHIDRNKIVTVLGNLFDNSFDAIQKSGHQLKQVNLSMTDLGDSLIFEVEDSGEGVDNNLIHKIFEKGVSSKDGSDRGYGLYLVNDIVNAFNGSINISDSELGGAAFTVIIPKTEVKNGRH